MEAIKGPSKWKPIHKDNIVTRDKVSDWLYIFDEVNCTYFYLIVGEKKALLFDTGYAFTNIRPLVDEIVGDKPLYVVCSHGHDDHVLGCSQFPEAYFSFADWDLCMKNDNPEQLEKQILARRESAPDIDNLVNREEYYKTSFANTKFHDAKDGDVFDLGIAAFGAGGQGDGKEGDGCQGQGDQFGQGVLHGFVPPQICFG